MNAVFHRWLLLVLVISFYGACSLNADTSILRIKGQPAHVMESHATDLIRENLIHIFDSSQFHQMEGGHLEVKEETEIIEELNTLKDSSYLKLTLDEPAILIVEGRKLRAVKLWVRIREADGFVYDWTLEQADGSLVALEKASGALVVQFAPFVLRLLEKYRLPEVKG